MKFIFSFIVTIACIAFTNCSNQKTQASSTCFKGRLEIKGICSNYTIKLLEGNLDTSKFLAKWKDETTGKNYTNVFALGSPCSFPSTIKAGDEFYFTLSNAKEQCPVCMAYYPTPSKKLAIKVIDSPCN
jgi:hypothetical protein